MKKIAIGFFALLFQLAGFAVFYAANADFTGLYNGMDLYFSLMGVVFILELLAFLLYLWLFIRLKSPRPVLLKIGMGICAGIGLIALTRYIDTLLTSRIISN